MPIEAGSVVSVVEDSPFRVVLELGRGRAGFDVVPSPKRNFVVRAGDVTVTVLGTAFTVERVADRVGVTVERGTVRVDWSVGTRQLNIGESGWFPPLVVDTRPTRRDPTRQQVSARPHRAVFSPSYRPVSEKSRGAAVSDSDETAGALLAAVDVERLAGRAERGASILRRLLREHGTDPRAPLAAFTLGRMLLMELGQPREAAAAFALVRDLVPGGAFAEDALAREVEAWALAGDAAEARSRAQEYLRLYPHGRRVANVKAFGGID